MSEFYLFVFGGGIIGAVLGLLLSTVDVDGSSKWSEFVRGWEQDD